MPESPVIKLRVSEKLLIAASELAKSRCLSLSTYVRGLIEEDVGIGPCNLRSGFTPESGKRAGMVGLANRWGKRPPKPVYKKRPTAVQLRNMQQ